MDPARHEEQDQGLNELIIPSVRDHPGFVAGYWMRDPQAKAGITTDSLPSSRCSRRPTDDRPGP
jgi:hypothetical protein